MPCEKFKDVKRHQRSGFRRCKLCGAKMERGLAGHPKRICDICDKLTEYEKLKYCADQFWDKVEVSTSEECWNWTGCRLNKKWYGIVNWRSVSRIPMTSHRIAWQLERGKIPDGMHVLHKCDNCLCCNPGHMFLGTHLDNVKDRVVKGRTASGDRNGARTKPERNPFVRNHGSGLRGEDVHNAKLSNKQVLRLRAMYSSGRYTRSCLARKFGISITHACRIVDGLVR